MDDGEEDTEALLDLFAEDDVANNEVRECLTTTDPLDSEADAANHEESLHSAVPNPHPKRNICGHC